MTSFCRAPLSFMAHQRAIVGDTKMSVISNDHMGWMMCDGRTLAVQDYYLLWRVIGYNFGSNAGNSNTFKLPNAAGRVPGVIGEGADVNASTFNVLLGASIGEYEHTLTIGEMPSHKHGSNDVSGNTNGNGNTSTAGEHTHSINDPGHSHSLPLQSQGFADIGPDDDVTQGSGYNTGTNTTGITILSNGAHFHTIGSTGGSNSHNNVQPMIGLGNMFIFSGKYFAPSDASIPFNGFPYLSNSAIL